VANEMLHTRAYGMQSAAQQFAFSFMRYMYEFGIRAEHAAAVKAIHSEHASCNPKALYPQRVTVQDVLNSRMICQPLHLLDCCVESDNATALIVTSRDRAEDLRAHPVLVRAVVGRCCKPRPDMHYQHGPITTTAGAYARERLWSLAGLGPQEVDVTGTYDAFTFTVLMQLEDYGFCAKGEAGGYVSDGAMRLGGLRPNNTSGGLLCEGYTHGLSLVIENVRQLRHDADDSCPVGADGRRRHTFDHRAGGCRQVRGAEISVNMGWGQPAVSSALVLRRG
jgi:acetyl-CoA acetyltransferase